MMREEHLIYWSQMVSMGLGWPLGVTFEAIITLEQARILFSLLRHDVYGQASTKLKPS